MPKNPFVLASTDHGSMILNRLDYNHSGSAYYGVGYNLLERGCFDPEDVLVLKKLLDLRRQIIGDGIIAIDAGANIGVHTIEWAKHMTGWGEVISIEAQERIFYALAGNIAINNCFNARAIYAALSNEISTLKIPVPNYTKPASFGSLELKHSAQNEFIGQNIDYTDAKTIEIETKTIDSLNLKRIDLIKIDVEGMELEVLAGARESIKNYKPIMFIEYIKTDRQKLHNLLEEYDYKYIVCGINIIAFHKNDKIYELSAQL